MWAWKKRFCNKADYILDLRRTLEGIEALQCGKWYWKTSKYQLQVLNLSLCTRNISNNLISVWNVGDWKLLVTQGPEPDSWSWYINVREVAKQIDHILVGTRWRILQHCRFLWSAEDFVTWHKHIVAALELRTKPEEFQDLTTQGFIQSIPSV